MLMEELNFDENQIGFNATAGSKFEELKELANEMNFEAEDPQPFLGFSPQFQDKSVEDSYDEIF